jgi:hypothetical protein
MCNGLLNSPAPQIDDPTSGEQSCEVADRFGWLEAITSRTVTKELSLEGLGVDPVITQSDRAFGRSVLRRLRRLIGTYAITLSARL